MSVKDRLRILNDYCFKCNLHLYCLMKCIQLLVSFLLIPGVGALSYRFQLSSLVIRLFIFACCTSLASKQPYKQKMLQGSS